MEGGKCIICLEGTTPSVAKKGHVLCPSGDGDLLTLDQGLPTKLKDELTVTFALRHLLQIPDELFGKFLKKYGNPSEWGVSICGSCADAYLNRAKMLSAQAAEIEKQFSTLRSQVKSHVNSSQLNFAKNGDLGANEKPKPRGKRKNKTGPTPAFSEIRQWIVDSTPTNIKEDIDAIIKAAGGIDSYVAQMNAERNFRMLGPGRTLAANQNHNEPGASSSFSMSMATSQPPASNSNSTSTAKASNGINGDAVSEQKRAAAAAALARFEKSKKPEADSKELLASRQSAFIKEQARKELEMEKTEDATDSTSTITPTEGNGNEIPVRIIDPGSYAVSGVYFSCPSLFSELKLPKTELEGKIKEHLTKKLKSVTKLEEQVKITCDIIQSCNKPVERVTACVELLLKYLENIINDPTNDKYRKVRVGNQAFKDRVAPIFGAESFLRAAGFTRTMLPNPDKWNEEEEDYFLFETDDEDSFVAELIEIRDMLKSTKPIKLELHRDPKTLVPSQLSSKNELPDEFFTLSASELKKEQLSKTEKVERELTLRTKEMREREGILEQRIYRFGVMRVRFPDNTVLQGTFGAWEKISDLLHFVRQNLVSSDLDFYLVAHGGEIYKTSDENSNKSFAELKLLPSYIFNFRMDSIPESLANGELSYLSPTLLSD